MPKFGGQLTENEINFKLVKTCVVDTWIVIFMAIMKNDPLVLLQSPQLNECFLTLLEKIRDGEYEHAKLLVAKRANIKVQGNCVNFYGNEYSLIVEPFLKETFKRELTWKCTSRSCAKREGFLSIYSISNISSARKPGRAILQSEFMEEVKKWFSMRYISECRRPLAESTINSTSVPSYDDETSV